MKSFFPFKLVSVCVCGVVWCGVCVCVCVVVVVCVCVWCVVVVVCGDVCVCSAHRQVQPYSFLSNALVLIDW